MLLIGLAQPQRRPFGNNFWIAFNDNKKLTYILIFLWGLLSPQQRSTGDLRMMLEVRLLTSLPVWQSLFFCQCHGKRFNCFRGARSQAAEETTVKALVENYHLGWRPSNQTRNSYFCCVLTCFNYYSESLPTAGEEVENRRPLIFETAAPEKLWPGNVRALQYPHQARKVTEFGTMS